jgi:hypothetical protein
MFAEAAVECVMAAADLSNTIEQIKVQEANMLTSKLSAVVMLQWCYGGHIKWCYRGFVCSMM